MTHETPDLPLELKQQILDFVRERDPALSERLQRALEFRPSIRVKFPDGRIESYNVRQGQPDESMLQIELREWPPRQVGTGF